MFSRPTLRLLHSLPKPVLVGALLTGAAVLANYEFPAMRVLREPAEVLFTGLTGFLAATWSRLSAWRLELVAGMIGALLVAGFYLAVTILLQMPLDHALGPALLRAILLGGIGAGLARLLRQRAVL